MAILSSFESEEREMYIGFVEAANGVGLLFGPLFGAALYSYGGYTMPFLTFSMLYLAAYPYIYWSLNKSKSQIERGSVNEETSVGQSTIQKQEIELSALMSKPRFVFGLLAQMFMMMSI